MRVLFITDNHTPTGGAENYFFELKTKLQNTPGMQVFSLGFGPKKVSGENFWVYPAARNHFTKLLWRLFLHPLVYLQLRARIKQIQPDIIHLHNIKQYPFSILKAIQGYPLVQTVHDFSPICPTGQNIHQDLQPCKTGIHKTCFWQHRVKYSPWVYLALSYSFYKTRRSLKKMVRHFIAPSPLLADYLEKNAFSPVTYIPPFKKEEAQHSCTTRQDQHFLFAGNLGKHKGVHLLIKEFALACQKNPALTLTMAGSGPEENALKEQIKTFGIEKNVRLVGWQMHLDSFYEKCTALIFPSIGLESFGLVITEAMSHGRAVIGIRRGTAAWLVDDQQTGLLFDPHTPGDLAEKILTLANNPKLATTLGENGYKKLHALFDNEEALRQVVSVYNSVVIPSPRPSHCHPGI